ncbi:hypothetical protein FPANT_6806 [Fusarium pseudoanthophilum]|uniref:Uncharacterized protein n=1 Tax=Fusarium pseudoanthophilum TaxID=48495 RepID=A0A8H5P5R7_9HYPO|nr:hypothetical protein FPANT_6806 [Fusarium pseudoanthophilum]
MSSQAAVKAEDFDFSADEPTVVGPNESDIATTQHGLCPRPIESELTPHGKADQYLEVGLVIGEEPSKYKPTGLSQNKERQAEQAAMGVLDRSQNVMRTFIRISEYIQPQTKLVAMLEDESEGAGCPREQDMQILCRDNPGAASQAQGRRRMEPKRAPSGIRKHQYNDEGDAAFFHDKRDEPLSDETMSSLVTEFKPANPTHTDLSKEVVQAQASHDRAFSSSSKTASCRSNPDDNAINTKVRAIFTSTQVHANYTTCTPETASTSSSRAHADEMTEKRGLVLSKSIDDVMAQLNNAIDVSGLRAGLEQLASIHACLLASNKASLYRQLDSAIDGIEKGILRLRADGGFRTRVELECVMESMEQWMDLICSHTLLRFRTNSSCDHLKHIILFTLLIQHHSNQRFTTLKEQENIRP